MARRRRDLAIFIPVPMGLGTLGAFIQIKSLTKSRRAVFDVAIAILLDIRANVILDCLATGRGGRVTEELPPRPLSAPFVRRNHQEAASTIADSGAGGSVTVMRAPAPNPAL
jgi:hypothetical protein